MALLLVATHAVGAEGVIDLVSTAPLRVVTRLENELRALGYRVVRRGPWDSPTPGATGEVTCSPHQLVARVAAAPLAREATFDDPDDDAVWAIRVTEWLRADASSLQAPVVELSHQAEPVRAPVVRGPPTLEVRLGGAGRFSPGLGVGGGGSAGLTVWPWRGFGFELTVPGLTWLEVSRDGLVASVRELSVALRAVTRFEVSARWSVLIGAGGGVRHVFVQGLTPATAGVGTLVGEVSVFGGLRFKVVGLFFVEWRSEVGLPLPAIALEFSGTLVGLVGTPGLQTGLSGGFAW